LDIIIVKDGAGIFNGSVEPDCFPGGIMRKVTIIDNFPGLSGKGARGGYKADSRANQKNAKNFY